MEFFDHSPVLFVKTDGKALEFYTYYTGEDKSTIQAMIEHGGGRFRTERKYRAFLLVEAGDENCEKVDNKQTAVSMKFIWDCVQQNQLLDINDYIIPLVIPFSKDEDLTIIKYVLMYADSKYGTLCEFFEHLSSKKVLERDAYSIKSRAKRIYWRFNTYCLTEEEERKFKLIIKPSAMRDGMCEEDDYTIINYVHDRVHMLHEKEIYNEIKRKGILNYSSNVLYSRAITHIFPNIDLYEISSALKKKIKAHLSDIYGLSNKSSADDYTIVQYMLCNIHSMRNVTTYKILKEKKEQNCSIHYLFLRFLYYILPNIDSYNIFPYFKRRFKNAFTDGFALCYDFSIQTKCNAWFSEDEDYLLIYSIQNTKKSIYDIAVYKDMENNQIFRRSAQAMKNRFFNRILPDIDSYNIPSDVKIAFKMLRKKAKTQKEQKRKFDCESDFSISSSDVSGSSESWYLPEEYSESLITEKSGSVLDGDTVSEVRLLRSQNMLDKSHESDIVPPSYSQSTVGNTSNANFDIVNIEHGYSSPLHKSLKPHSGNERSTRTEADATHLNLSKNKKSRLETDEMSRNKPSSSSNCLTGNSLTNNSSYKRNEATEKLNANHACSGDLRNYFSAKSSGLQRRLGKRNKDDKDDRILNSQSSDILQASSCAFSQGSIIDDIVNDPLAPPTFLSVLLKRIPKMLGNRLSWLSTNQSESHEYFPVDEKVQFLSDTINLMQDIEVTELFQAYVVDSEFYSELAAKLYKITKNVYESFLEKEVENILKKGKLNYQDKTVLMKYLACLNQLSPDDTKKLVNEFVHKSYLF